jgi:phospholipid/cholesterol/gamma-HCH transport system substrate-binding protein
MKRIISNLESTSEQIGIIGHNLDSIVSDFRSGEGAYQYLTQDPDAAMRIDSTLINIQQSSEKFNENMEAMRANFLFRGYFRKQEKEAEKARKKAARDQ